MLVSYGCSCLGILGASLGRKLRNLEKEALIPSVSQRVYMTGKLSSELFVSFSSCLLQKLFLFDYERLLGMVNRRSFACIFFRSVCEADPLTGLPCC